ncbi:hypothetical protein BDY24DRAFT_139269 [Mrakia frigida]|uniref:uncharacterized protein n=1 Tax=Mrakia frigida TaxID=29902 RepID=UPI003FCBFF83
MSDVVEPLVSQLRELIKTSEYQLEDHALTLTLQTQLLILDILSAVLPKPPAHPSDPEPFPTTLPLEEPSLSLLLEALPIIISTTSLTAFSSILNGGFPRNSEDSGRGSLAGRSTSNNTINSKKQQQQHIGRHQNSSSRSGPFSPTSSSNSLPQDGQGGSIRNGEAGSSEQQRSSNFNSVAVAPAFEALVRARAAELMRAISFFRWDVVWSSIRGKLQSLASESLDDTGLSETCIEACFIDRPRLVQVLSELSPVFIHLPRTAQSSVSDSLYRAIWSWIRYSPADFVQLYRTGQRLEGDPSSLFDVCFNVIGDTDKKAHTFWPVMTMLLALCPDLIVKVLEANPQKQTSVTSSMGKKINFIESIHSAFYSTKLSNSAKRACLDLVELASLLPSDIEHAGLLMWVSDFAGDLQDQLLNGKETPDADLVSNGLEHFYRRDPDSLSRTLPKLNTPFERICLARACTSLSSTAPISSPPFSLDLISSVGNLLADYVISLKSTSRTIADSATTTGSLRELRQPDVDLILSILQLYSADIRFLVSFKNTDKVAILLNLLSSMLCEPAPEVVRSAASAAFKSIYRQAGRMVEGGQSLELSQEVYEYLGSTSWRSVGNAAHQVLNLGIDDASSREDMEILSDTFSLACGFAATYLQAHASSTTIREGLAMHEVALTLTILSPEEEVVAVAVAAFKRRHSELTHVVVSILGSTISDSSPGLELLDAQKGWKEDMEALFPTGQVDSRLTFAAMNKVLSSRPAASRAHAFAFKLLFEKWERTLISIRAGATSTDSREFVEWSHLGSVLCILGQSCLTLVELRDGPSRPDLLTVELLEEFVQGLCDCLVQKELTLRSSVEAELSQLGPGLLEMLLHSLLKTSRDIFRRLPTPTLQDLGTSFVSHALNILIATVPSLTTPISSDPGPLLANLTQRLDRNLATLAGIPSESTTVEGVTTVVSSLQRACQLCEIIISKRDLFDWSALPVLRNELLDRLSNWTTWNLTINPRLLPTAFVELDYSCISTAATLAEGLKLQAGYRVGGSRKRLFESWFSLLHHHLLQALRSKPLALTTRESSLSRNLPDFPTAVGITLSNLLSHNGDVAFDRCIAMTYSLDLAVRAVYIKVVGEATRKLVVKEKRNRFEIDDRHPLLEILVEPGMLLLPILTDIYSRVDHDTVSDLVLRRFERQDAGFDLLKALVEIEISQTTQEAEIFRGTTLCTKVYSQFARRHARNYLRNLLRPFVQAIIDDNPAYGSGSTARNDAPQNSLAIESLAQTLLDRLCSSLSRVPQ